MLSVSLILPPYPKEFSLHAGPDPLPSSFYQPSEEPSWDG